MKTITTEIINITPEIAKHLLSFNFNNRPIKKKNLAYWRACFTSNSVAISHQGIAVQGPTLGNPIRLLDGQHRLAIIAEMGISHEMLIAYNVPEAAFENLDNGMARSLSDRTGIEKRDLELINSFYYFFFYGGDRPKPPIELVREIGVMLAPESAYVKCRNIRNLSPAPIRLAFVVEQKLFGRNHSEAFQGGDFGEMTPSLMALYRRQTTDPIWGGAIERAKLFCAAVGAINSPSKNKITTPRDCTAAAREILDQAYPDASRIFAKYKPQQ